MNEYQFSSFNQTTTIHNGQVPNSNEEINTSYEIYHMKDQFLSFVIIVINREFIYSTKSPTKRGNKGMVVDIFPQFITLVTNMFS